MEVDLKNGQGKEVGLLISSLGHAALVFVNKRLVGNSSGDMHYTSNHLVSFLFVFCLERINYVSINGN